MIPMNALAKIMAIALGPLVMACAAKQVAPPSTEDVRAVSPALDAYTKRTVLGELWQRPGLAARDRSLVTLAVLIARNQSLGGEMKAHFELALKSGVKPAELSELVTHLAFYSGWANASAAVVIAKRVFEEHGIDPSELSPVSVPLLPLDEAAERQRATRVEENFGAIAPGVVHYTTDLLFRDVWLRPGLAPRDRSMVTVAALIANGQVAQVDYHLNRAMDNGLTKTEVSEMMTQLAFYAGWPNVFSALPIVKLVLDKR